MVVGCDVLMGDGDVVRGWQWLWVVTSSWGLLTSSGGGHIVRGGQWL